MAFYAAIGKRPIHVKREVKGHIANRLQAALWREAFHLVDQGVASVADIDAAIAHGPGLRWAVMGPFMNLHLSGGAGGIAHVLAHLGGPIEDWWKDLGAPTMTAELKQQVAEGVAAELGERRTGDLEAARDTLLLNLIRAKTGHRHTRITKRPSRRHSDESQRLLRRRDASSPRPAPCASTSTTAPSRCARPSALKPYARCVGEWLERWARETPDALALAERDASGEGWRRLDYRAAAPRRRRASRRACSTCGVPADQPVVILSDNAIDHALLMLAAMHIGRAGVLASPAPTRRMTQGPRRGCTACCARCGPALIYASDAKVYGARARGCRHRCADGVQPQRRRACPARCAFEQLLPTAARRRPCMQAFDAITARRPTPSTC